MPALRPSMTFWNRLEPRPRSNDLANALAARVRDPAWFLARQWQLGEFHGEDAGSPAYVRIQGSLGAIGAWAPGIDPNAITIGGNTSLERAVTPEGASPNDLALAIELGQTFDRMLIAAGLTGLRDAFLAAYPIGAAAQPEDPGTTRLRALVGARSINGVVLHLASLQPPVIGQPPPGVPAAVPTAQWTDAGMVVGQLTTWVTSTIGTIADVDPVAWQPDQLDYAARVFSSSPTTGSSVLAFAASPHRDGDLSWHSLDMDGHPVTGFVSAQRPVTIAASAIPAPVRFRGMPNERFWDFEDSRVDFGGLRPDRRNLASMLLMDFMLVHGNDWFIVLYEMPIGGVASTALTVVDVFGTSTAISRADAIDPAWTMFSIADTNGAAAPYFVMPQSCASVVLDGAPIEEVRLLRDDTASLAWGVEHATEGTLGIAWSAADRIPSVAPAAPASTFPVAYRIQTPVPENWFPFQPVKLTTGDEIALELSALLSLDGPPSVPQPLGRILAPSSISAGEHYRVRETEIPREGARVVRRVRRARDSFGGTEIWVARARSVGTGEGWSGLRWDLAVPSE